MEFKPYEVNVASYDFSAVMLPSGVVIAKIIWGLATDVPPGIWHSVGTIYGTGLEIISNCVEIIGTDAVYFACSAGSNMCTICVRPNGEVLANPTIKLLTGVFGTAQMRFTPFPL